MVRPQGGVDTIHCELPGCTNTMQHSDSSTQAYCYIIVLQYVDANGYKFYQCNQGSLVDGHTWQHWHCSHAHRNQNINQCINTHFQANKLASIPAGQGSTILHQTVLNANLNCVQCGQPVTTSAYRFTILAALPFTEPISDHSDLGDWCDTLAHARVQAMAQIRAYVPQ